MTSKQVSFRLKEEEIEKFRAFADENNIKQSAIFSKLIESFELAKAKGIVSDRCKEIEAMEGHLQGIQTIYLSALEINKNTEDTIKENYSKELVSKDQIIMELQEKNKLLGSNIENIKTLEKSNEELTKIVATRDKDLILKAEEFQKLNDSNSALSQIVAEYKEYKINNDILEMELKEVATHLTEKETNLKDTSNKLNTSIKELSTIKDFYQQEIKEIKADNRQTVSDNKHTFEISLKEEKEENKKTIKEMKIEHKSILENIQKNCDATLKDLKVEHKLELSNTKKGYEEAIKGLKVEHKEIISALKSERDVIMEQQRKEIEELRVSKLAE